MRQQIKHPASDTTRTVALERTADDECAFEAIIDDRIAPVEIERLDDESGWLRMNGRVHRYYVLRRDHNVTVWIDSRIHTFELPQPTARRAGAADSGGAASNQLTAPMPGTILKINGAAGDTYEPHAPIVIMESMKMEMSLSAPGAVTLKSIDCAVGELVEMGRVLAQLEPVADAE